MRNLVMYQDPAHIQLNIECTNIYSLLLLRQIDCYPFDLGPYLGVYGVKS